MSILGKVFTTLGLLAMALGAGIFVYFIFIRDGEIPEGGVRAAAGELGHGRREIVVETPVLSAATKVKPIIAFNPKSEYVRETKFRTSSGQSRGTHRETAFRVWTKLSLVDSTGRRLYERRLALDEKNSTRVRDGEGRSLYGGNRTVVEKSNGEWQYLAADPLDAAPQGRVTARLELLDLPKAGLEKPEDDPGSNLGELQNVALYIYREVADVKAYSRLGSEAPMWGLWVAGGGLLSLLLGAALLSRSRAGAPQGSRSQKNSL